MKKVLVVILLLIPIIVLLSINVSGLIISAEISISIESITLTHKGNAVISEQIMLEDYKNKNYRLFADYYPRIAQNKSIIWQSNDENVATVKGGIVTFHDYGSVDITATAESYTSISATCTFYVIGEEIDKITVSEFGENSPKKQYQLKKYEIVPLRVSVIPSMALSQNLKYKSNDESIVTVDDNGILTAINNGQTTVKISADSKSGKKITETITVTVEGVALLMTDTIYTSSSVIDLSPYLNYPNTILHLNNIPLDSTIIDLANNEETIIEVSHNGITESVTIVKKQTANALVFKNLYAMKKGIWLDDNYITENSSNVVLNAIASEGILPQNAEILWQSNNEEVVTVSNGRIFGHRPGTAIITASLDDYESAEIEVTVATSISYVRLELSNSKDKLGLAESRVFGTKTCKNKVISDQFPLNISSSYPDITEAPDYRRLFYYYSSNEEYATIDEEGIITFYEEGAGKEVTITAAAKYSHIDAKASYTFSLVDGINLGYGYGQNQYDEKIDKMPSYEPFDDFLYLSNDYRDDYTVFGKALAIVFHTNVYMPKDAPLVILCRSIYGNGYKFDGQFHTDTYNTHMFHWGIHGFFITERPHTVTIENFAIQSYRPTSDDSKEAFSELAVKGGLPWQTVGDIKDYEGIVYHFKFCLFQYAYTHCDISSGNVIFEGCIFRNTAGPAIYAGTSNSYAAQLTLKNCIFSNIISTALLSTSGDFPDSPAAAKQSRADVKYHTLKLEGDNYFYNWKNINDLDLKVIPDALAPLNTLNNTIAEWVRLAVKQADQNKFVHTTLKGDYVNMAMIFLPLWVDNNLLVNPPSEHFYYEGISVVADTAKYRVEDIDLGVIPVNELIRTMLNSYRIKLLTSPVNVVFAKGSMHGYNTMPDETYELNAVTLARLRGE